MRILHLSDLHFGIKASKERTREEIAVRNFYINDLINGLGSIAKKDLNVCTIPTKELK